MEKFKQLGISEGILNAIKAAGFTEPSEIQEKTIPLVVQGKDIIAGSATGSGKTLAFGAGIIDKVKHGLGIQALIMTPTRELAEQVAKNIKYFSRHAGLNVKEIYGGVGMTPQIRDLRYTDIVVGTPGRILDHLQNGTINLSRVKYLVLDEADRMLDMGFIRDVEKIINNCPKERQTLLFSATISQDIVRLSERYMKNPVQVNVKNQIDSSQLYQTYYEPDTAEKFSLLVHLLKQEKEGVVMVFCNTRRNVDRLTRALYDQGMDSLAIHGGLSQNQRSRTLQAFHEGEALILVCTDVAARGLDIKGVSHVYNFDIPTTSTEYTHRIGRTARAGKNGIAISFVCPGDRSEFKQIFRENPKLERLNVPKFEQLESINFGSNDERKMKRMNAGRGGFSRGRGGGRGGRGGYSRVSGGDRGRESTRRSFGGRPRFGGRDRDSGRDGGHSHFSRHDGGSSRDRTGRPVRQDSGSSRGQSRFSRGNSRGSRGSGYSGRRFGR